MTRLKKGTEYIERRNSSGAYQDWWIVKARPGSSGYITQQQITLPKEMVGKCIRIKIEKISEPKLLEIVKKNCSECS